MIALSDNLRAWSDNVCDLPDNLIYDAIKASRFRVSSMTVLQPEEMP